MKHLKTQNGVPFSHHPPQQQQQQQLEEKRPPEFCALLPDALQSRSSFMFKLTDECIAAINDAAVGRRKIRIHYLKDSCIFEVSVSDGTVKRFDCVVQPVGHPMDAISYNSATKQYQTIGALITKLQVRATDRTFAETREKAQKLVEEQQKHKAKDMNSRIHKSAPLRNAVTAASQRRLLTATAGSSGTVAASGKPRSSAISIKPSNASAPNIAKTEPKPPDVPKQSPNASKSGSRGLMTTSLTMSTTPAHRSPLTSQLEQQQNGLLAKPPVTGSNGTTGSTSAPLWKTPSPPTSQLNNALAGGASARIGYAPKNPPSSFRKRPASVLSESPGTCLTESTRPTRDWRLVFSEIRSFDDAKRYHDIFAKEYPEYYDCYQTLMQVAKEFSDMEKALNALTIGSLEYDKLEDAIQNKFAKYQNDSSFLAKRQRHTDLRAKLDVLKKRIIDWERQNSPGSNDGEKRGDNGQQSNGTEMQTSLADLMVM